MIKCNKCGSQLCVKFGWTQLVGRRVQRYLCKECGHPFREADEGGN